ncbi:hypothetical protein [Streptomyces flaveus]|uniref:hypothetical protein n=1 Tax=Streptomyces flaveus TaxID=66370 RepID=UPI0033264A52
MANFLDDQTDAKRLAQLLAEYDRRLQALERTTQASYTSIEGGSLDIYDDEGTLKGSVGVQPDGGVALVPVNTTPPPTPTPPTVEPALAGLLIGWDGLWDDSYETPTDFGLVQVHVGAAEDFTPDLTTQVATITAVLGGTVTVHIEGYAPVWVRLVGQNSAAITGEPSAAVQGQARQAVAQDLLDNIINENKLTAGAVTAAKIALGAVNSTALADGAVLAEKLAKNSVTQAALAQGSVTLNALGGPLGDSATQRYVDTFRDPAGWEQLTAAGGTWNINPAATGTPSGGGLLTTAGDVQLVGKTLATQDTDTLYRVMIRVRATVQDTSGPATLYVGVAGVADDGVTLVNRAGAASTSMHYYCATNGGALTVADGWKTYVGYIQGRAAPSATAPAGPQNDPRLPGTTHANVRFLRPMVWLNFGKGAASVMEVDVVTIEALRTGVVNSTNLVTGSVTAAAIATDAVIAGKVAADAITGREIAANSVTAAEIAAGSVTADKLTIVGGANILADPGFEGAVTAALVSTVSYASQDKSFGNGSAASLKIDATSATAVYRDVQIALIPVSVGDQLYIAYDYYVSTDWVGASINMHVRWENATGTVIGYSVLGTNSPVRGAWTRIAGTVTAPAGSSRGNLRAQSAQATAGAVWWDNAALRPVVPGVQIADGAITTPKILAGAVTTDKLIALAVTAEKIASLAVTTDKLDALSVTADKLAVNSVTATKIAAGVIDATHIKAGAITAEKLDADAINGKTITGATIRTAASGGRIVLDSARLTAYGAGAQKIVLDPNNDSPFLYFTSDDGTNYAYLQVTGTGSAAKFFINSGKFTDSTDGKTYRWRTFQGEDLWVAERVEDGTTTSSGGRLQLSKSAVVLKAGGTTPSSGGRLQLTEDAVILTADRVTLNAPAIRAAGVFRADNISMGSVTITPVPDTPTSVTLSGGAVKGTTFRAWATPMTAAPGTQVKGVSVSSVSSAGLTIWLTRSNAFATIVHWQLIGEAEEATAPLSSATGRSNRQASLSSSLEPELRPEPMVATCHTEGCRAAGVPFHGEYYPNVVQPAFRGVCMPCGQPITDLVPANSEG